jgi:hypothetical protein
MKRNFVELYESAMQRYTIGGLLAGDVVVFREGAFNDPWYKGLGENTKEKIQSMAKSGLNLRVSSIKSVLPAVQGAGNTDYNGTEFNVDITSEIAPGRYMDFVTVPARMLKPISSYPNLPEVPEVFKKGDPARRVNIKPKKLKGENEEVPFFSPKDTMLSDLGDKKLSKGDRALLNTNVKIPSQPVQGQADPASYTYKYLPKR